MKRILGIAITVAVVTGANAGKVVWDKNGKPKIEKSKKPIKGCQRTNPLEDKLGKPIQNPILKGKKSTCGDKK